MSVNERRTYRDVRAGARMEGGRWVAGAGLAYVAAWLVGLGIGLATASPAPTGAIQKIEAYFRAQREAAMIQAYFLDGLAGAALIVFAAALHSALRRFEGESATVSSILFGAGKEQPQWRSRWRAAASSRLGTRPIQRTRRSIEW